uniref:Uncharacterized protein n=1 Tax=Glossina austeni TaxID=7395 RepID=A0A1A9UGN2_GLOAU
MDTITENPESPYNIRSSNEHIFEGDIQRICEFTEDAACQPSGNARVKIESNDFRSSENEESQLCANLDNVRNTNTTLCTSFEEGVLIDTNDGQCNANTSSVDNNCESNCEKSASLVGRIRVKSEFSLKSDIPGGNTDHMPQGFLDDLLKDMDEKTGVVKLEEGNNQDKITDNLDAIPDNFFNDIFADQLTERIEAVIESNDFRSSENEQAQVCANLDNVRNTKTTSQSASTSLCTSIAKFESDFEEGVLIDTNDGQCTANTSSVDNNSESNCKKPGRISVKSEFSSKSDIPGGNTDHMPRGFLDDLLKDVDEKTGVVKLEAGSNQNKITDNVDAIPDNFFNDILVDQVTERIEAVITEEVEVKLSQRLEVLKELTLLEDSNKTKKSSKKKKHSKSRKKSRKRSHSSEKEEHLQKKYAYLSGVDSTQGNSLETLINPTSNISTFTEGFPCGVDKPCENTMTVGNIKLEKVIPTQESEGNLTTSKEKIDIAMLRASKALESFRTYSQKHIEGEFIFTPTIRKLPTDSSFGNRTFSEHRSCLHSVNNVSYKFSSLSKRLNMLEWGLEAAPSKIACACRVLCYDIYSLLNKSKSMKLPPNLLSSETRIMDCSFSLRNNISTQTDDDDIFNLRNVPNVSTYDAAVQSTPVMANIAVQTTEETSLDDLPIISIIRSFDSNQLMALHDFAELLREQCSPDTTHMYRMRERMLTIYNRAHMQSGSGEGRIQASQHRFERDNNPDPIHAIENVLSSHGTYYATDTSRMLLQRSEESREYAPSRDARSARQSPSSSTFVGKSYGRGCTKR